MVKAYTSEIFSSSYKDDYRDSAGFHRILFNSGRALQARELTQMQTIIQKELGRLGRHLFKEGASVNPGGVTVNTAYEFIKLNTTVNSLPTTPSDLVGVSLTSTNGIVVEVLEAFDATDSGDPATLYVKYTDTSSGTSGNNVIRVGAGENLSGGGYTLTVQSTNTVANPAVGTGTKASMHGGDFWVADHFVYAPNQSIILSKYTSNPSAVLGFRVTQDIVTVSDDVTLYDNQGATPNLASPGADRYRITLTLTTQDQTDSDQNFVTVAKIVNGEVVAQVTGTDDYNKINDLLALRTKEESGDYIARPFYLTFETDDTDTSLLNFVVSPGTAYVDGYRAATTTETKLPVSKPRTTASRNNEVVAANFGNYIICSGNKGLPNVNELELMNLRSATTHGGATIGTARVRHVQEDEGNYRLYIFDIRMNSGQTFRDVRSIGTSTTNYWDLVLESGNAVLKEPAINSLLFPLPASRVQSLSDISLTTQRRFTAVTDGSGNATINLTSIGEAFADADLWIAAGTDSDVFSPTFTTAPSGSTSAEINNGPASSTIEVLAYVNQGNGVIRTKTLKETTEVLTPDSDGNVTLSKPDIYQFVRITDTDSDGANLSLSFTEDNGQRDNYYGFGRLVLKSGQSAPAGNVFVRYKYFDHGSSGNFFARNSYAGQINYEDIPSYTQSNGDTVALRDVLDFRPVVNSSGTFASGARINELPRPTDLVNFDATYYLAKRARVVITTDGELKVIEGEPAANPVLPELPDKALELYRVYMKPYTLSDKDVTTTKIESKRFTMADIGRLEKRLDNLEEVTSLSLLELETSTLNVLDASGNNRTKSGFFVDNFTDQIRSFTFSPEYSASIDPTKKIMRPSFNQNNIRLFFDSDNVDQTNVVRKGDNLYLAYTEEGYISNNYMTGTENVNPFAVVTSRGFVEISPQSDEWMETRYVADKIIDGGIRFNNMDQETFWDNWNWNWSGVTASDAQINDIDPDQITVGTVLGTASRTTRSKRRSTTNTVAAVVTGDETVTEQIGDNVVSRTILPKMRSRRIYFKAQGLKPNTKMWPYFNNRAVDEWVREETFKRISTLDSDYSTGYENLTSHPDGSSELYTDAQGSVEGSFFLPSTSAIQFKCGEKEFKLLDISVPVDNDATSIATAIYSSVGILVKRQRSILSTRMIEVSRIEQSGSRRRKRIDPLAQSFLVTEDSGVFITNVKLRFATKPDVGPVVVQLRPMVNGIPASDEFIPGTTVFKAPGEVSVSTDGSAVTTFEFDEPAYLQGNTEYAIVVLTDSTEYNLYVAEAGAFLLGSTEKRLKRQATLGSLFKSQNGATWEPDQTKDMTFELTKAVFNTSGSLILENVGVPSEVIFNAITTTNGSATVQVAYPRHGFTIGDSVTLTTQSAVGGISAANLTGTFTVTAVDGTGFEFTAGGSATSSTIGGGDIVITHNISYDTLYLNVENIVPNLTGLAYYGKTISGKSLAGSEIPYVLDADFTPLVNTQNNYFASPRLVASRENELAELAAGQKSLTIRVDLTSESENVSPVIDLQRISAGLIGNKIDWQVASGSGGNIPLNYVAETSPNGGSHLAKHVAIPVQLAEQATGIKVILSANRPSTVDFDLYYRTNGGDTINLFEANWVLASKEESIPADENPDIFREYRYLIGGTGGTLDAFDQFQIKIVMKSTNSSKVPVFQDLRVIALTD